MRTLVSTALLVSLLLARTASAQDAPPVKKPLPTREPRKPPAAAPSPPGADQPPPANADQPAPTTPAKKATAPAAASGGETPLDRFRRGMLQLGFSGLSGLKIYRNGVAIGGGFMGLSLSSVFEPSPYAYSAFKTYLGLRISGTVLSALGTAALLAAVILVYTDSDKIRGSDGDPTALFWGLLIPGAAVSLSGAIMIGVAPGYLTDAVRRYNDDLYRKVRGQSARAFGLKVRGRF